jgi:hypothetical protein
VAFALPASDSTADLTAAMAAIAAAAGQDSITPDEALALSQMLEPLVGALAAHDKEERRQELAAYYAKSAGSGSG